MSDLNTRSTVPGLPMVLLERECCLQLLGPPKWDVHLSEGAGDKLVGLKMPVQFE